VPPAVSEIINDLLSDWDYLMAICRIVYLPITEKLG
jgi:hypothetical protein